MNTGSALRLGVDVQASTDQPRPFAHTDESKSAMHLLRSKTSSRILDEKNNLVRALHQTTVADEEDCPSQICFGTVLDPSP
jgi:hypothetical protein